MYLSRLNFHRRKILRKALSLIIPTAASQEPKIILDNFVKHVTQNIGCQTLCQRLFQHRNPARLKMISGSYNNRKRVPKVKAWPLSFSTHCALSRPNWQVKISQINQIFMHFFESGFKLTRATSATELHALLSADAKEKQYVLTRECVQALPHCAASEVDAETNKDSVVFLLVSESEDGIRAVFSAAELRAFLSANAEGKQDVPERDCALVPLLSVDYLQTTVVLNPKP
jgi:hypothetical protein